MERYPLVANTRVLAVAIAVALLLQFLEAVKPKAKLGPETSECSNHNAHQYIRYQQA